MFEWIPQFVWYALLGATVREAVGFWRAAQTFVDLKLAWKRILVTWILAWFFGIVGGEIIAQFNVLPIGINLIALFAGILSGDSITFLLKKLGWSQKLEIPVSEQQLQSGLNARQINALTIAKKFGKITNKIHQQVNATTRRVAQRDLEKLVLQGKLVRVGSGKTTYYVPARYAPNMHRENTHH